MSRSEGAPYALFFCSVASVAPSDFSYLPVGQFSCRLVGQFSCRLTPWNFQTTLAGIGA